MIKLFGLNIAVLKHHGVAEDREQRARLNQMSYIYIYISYHTIYYHHI